MDNRQANINRFEAEMAKVTRDGVDKLMAFIRKSDMYAAPASTRFHLSVTGGLLQHSLNVLDALRANLTKNDDGTYSYEVAGVPAARVTEENVIIMALLHDICKTGTMHSIWQHSVVRAWHLQRCTQTIWITSQDCLQHSRHPAKRP